MFTGVVVESFSYVFQLVGGTKSITREEMRAFKKFWAEHANPRTGYLEKSHLVPFLSVGVIAFLSLTELTWLQKLSGVFEVRIYPVEYSIKNLMAMAHIHEEDTQGAIGNSAQSQTGGIDVAKLNRILSGLDYSKIRKRKTLYARMYNEAMISQEPGKGISFTHMLLMLAHHKLIDDREALSLKELVTRTEINKFVNDLVDLDRVRSLLKAIYYRRHYRAQREMQLRQTMYDQDIPAIVVDELPSTPPSTRDITSANRDSMGFLNSTPPSPSPNISPDPSFALETPSRRGRGLQRHRRVSDTSMLSTDLGYEYPCVSLYLFLRTSDANLSISGWKITVILVSSMVTMSRSCSRCKPRCGEVSISSCSDPQMLFTPSPNRNDDRSSRRFRGPASKVATSFVLIA